MPEIAVTYDPARVALVDRALLREAGRELSHFRSYAMAPAVRAEVVHKMEDLGQRLWQAAGPEGNPDYPRADEDLLSFLGRRFGNVAAEQAAYDPAEITEATALWFEMNQ